MQIRRLSLYSVACAISVAQLAGLNDRANAAQNYVHQTYVHQTYVHHHYVHVHNYQNYVHDNDVHRKNVHDYYQRQQH